MGHEINRHPENRFSRDSWELFDDFTWYVDAHQWTKVLVGTGTLDHEGDAGRSCVKLFCTAANDASVLATTNEIGEFTASKAIICETRIIFTDVNTDDGHVQFGLCDLVDGSQSADTTGVVTATDALLIHKLPDTTVWRCHSEINGLQNKTGDGASTSPDAQTISNVTAGGSSFQTLRIELIPRTSTIFDATFFVDGAMLKTSAGLPIHHAVALGTSTEMHFQLMTKSNHANDFNLYCDYMYLACVR